MDKISLFFKRMTLNPKLIFLIDGLGALLSTFLLGFVLIELQNLFGMPAEVLHFLATIASIFALYSFICAFCINKNWRFFLKIIAIFNLSYCILTFFLVYANQIFLTNLGVIYFSIEIIIITILALFEIKLASLDLS